MTTTATVRERPIIFTGESVRAILAGRKTQTRRVVTDATSCGNYYPPSCCEMTSSLVFADPGPSPAGSAGPYLHAPVMRERDGTDIAHLGSVDRIYPRWWVGDHAWVRESGWQPKEPSERDLREGADTWPRYAYDADEPLGVCYSEWGWKHRPSIHMPRWASRLTLELTDVRVERVQDISEDDAIAEGIEVVNRLVVRPDTRTIEQSPRAAFSGLWDSINAKRGYGWDANPWVWALTFKVVG